MWLWPVIVILVQPSCGPHYMSCMSVCLFLFSVWARNSKAKMHMKPKLVWTFYSLPIFSSKDQRSESSDIKNAEKVVHISHIYSRWGELIYCQCLGHLATGHMAAHHVGSRRWRLFLLNDWFVDRLATVILTTMFVLLSSFIMALPLQSSLGSFDQCSTAPGGRRPLAPANQLEPLAAIVTTFTNSPLPFITESWYSFYYPTLGRRLSYLVARYIDVCRSSP